MSLRRSPRILVPFLVLLALGVVPLAAGATVTWNEQAKASGKAVMGFKVSSLTIGASSWSAHVSFTNLSSRTVKIGDRFGAAIYADAKTTDLDGAVGFAPADRFAPARPTELKPGATWTGVIGGTGHLATTKQVWYARVVFGPLTDLQGQSKPVYWVTDHSLPLSPTSGGPVI